MLAVNMKWGLPATHGWFSVWYFLYWTDSFTIRRKFSTQKVVDFCLGSLSINSGCCAVAGGSELNIVSGFCDNCKSTQTYEALMRHKNNLLCQCCFQKGNSKLLLLLIHICVHISLLAFITKMVVTLWNQLSNFVYIWQLLFNFLLFT